MLSKRRYDDSDRRRQTSRNQRALHDYAQRAADLAGDSDRLRRLSEGECKACWYLGRGRIAGAAMTDADCVACGTTVTYSSIATNKLCAKCAHDLNVCIRCGGEKEC